MSRLHLQPLTQRVALKEAVKRLTDARIETPTLDARLLVQDALGTDWSSLFTGPDLEVTREQALTLEDYLQRRILREPVSRILGHRGFWSLEFEIGPSTLDPRPDTETVVQGILDRTLDRAAPLSILDLGTGSGAILISLLHELPNAKGVGIDIAPEAVEIAARNAETLGVGDRARFAVGNWTDGILESFDIIVSNPPYIPEDFIPGLAPEVKNYDPMIALDGGIDGLKAYKQIVPTLKPLLREQSLIAVEIGAGQASSIVKLFIKEGFEEISAVRDLGGTERCLVFTVAKKKNLASGNS